MSSRRIVVPVPDRQFSQKCSQFWEHYVSECYKCSGKILGIIERECREASTHNRLISLDLSYSQLHHGDILAIVKTILTYDIVKSVDLSGNGISPKTMSLVSRLLHGGGTLEIIKMKGCGLDQTHMKAFSTAAIKKDQVAAKNLDFSSNKIDKVACIELCPFLESPTCSLICLNLSQNPCKDAGAKAILRAVSSGTTQEVILQKINAGCSTANALQILFSTGRAFSVDLRFNSISNDLLTRVKKCELARRKELEKRVESGFGLSMAIPDSRMTEIHPSEMSEKSTDDDLHPTDLTGAKTLHTVPSEGDLDAAFTQNTIMLKDVKQNFKKLEEDILKCNGIHSCKIPKIPQSFFASLATISPAGLLDSLSILCRYTRRTLAHLETLEAEKDKKNKEIDAMVKEKEESKQLAKTKDTYMTRMKDENDALRRKVQKLIEEKEKEEEKDEKLERLRRLQAHQTKEIDELKLKLHHQSMARLKDEKMQDEWEVEECIQSETDHQHLENMSNDDLTVDRKVVFADYDTLDTEEKHFDVGEIKIEEDEEEEEEEEEEEVKDEEDSEEDGVVIKKSTNSPVV
ncbi:hypothetical protein ADUPG1_000405 [Aduncisulcus paluster]|uniref:Uncharacterized protein n=1 Tax=Aduncisulcus paluster TaxID=2918883 RepID=A0ABQ5K6P1_9EUKA|nr:hypothetical protein ADUPG1_000405 [Aduncisulcus paluster]